MFGVDQKLLSMVGPMVREMLGIEPEKVIETINLLQNFGNEIMARLDRIENRLTNLERMVNDGNDARRVVSYANPGIALRGEGSGGGSDGRTGTSGG